MADFVLVIIHVKFGADSTMHIEVTEISGFIANHWPSQSCHGNAIQQRLKLVITSMTNVLIGNWVKAVG